MGKKKMKLPFLFQSKSLDPKTFSSSLSNSSSSQPWPFPSCGNIKTLSFRAKDNDDDAFRTFNSAFLESEMTPPESCFTISSSSRSFSTMSEDSGDPLESVIRGLRSDRLFFEPERSSSLLLHLQDERSQELEPQQLDQQPIINPVSSEDSELVVDYKESEVLSMDSNSPYEDFRRSMEEMVEAHGVKDWQGLEQLLGCYLKINGKNNHGYIVGAFIDLLVNLSFASFESSSTSTPTTRSTTTTTTTTTTTSSSYSNYSSPSSPLSLPSSSLTTPCLSSILDHGDVDEQDEDDDHV
ncbi:transcription repressor OFP13-like [Chenopodium quinoa]|uniref:transcription repressor OFP13-like n=1 Tax=Chenopodium quinoa TaxID=63459 RepID=UPI000B77865E|nr:transcription repressor OFP13-like [Chenopodium quinoa]